MFTILIALISLVGLIVLHEFGHFIFAKRYGVKVEEFGVGLPPRIFGKKIGETIYSLNLLPFGAFVKIYGEEGGIEDSRSFSERSIYQRAMIVVAGVAMFWIASWVLLSIASGIGSTVPLRDGDPLNNLTNPQVSIVAVAPDSSAAKAGIEIRDNLRELKVGEEQLIVNKTKEASDFFTKHQDDEIIFTIERQGEIFETNLYPEVLAGSNEEDKKIVGISMTRTAVEKYSWYEAPIQGAIKTKYFTSKALEGWAILFSSVWNGEGVPKGFEVAGPIGIFSLFDRMTIFGAGYFLQFVALVSIFLALFNLLPIPALDGGRLVFLGLEAIRGKPISVKIEQKLIGFSFVLLILLLVVVTFFDIQKLLP